MLDGKKLNEMLGEFNKKVNGMTREYEVTAGQVVKIEGSPTGFDLDLGMVPPGKKWILKFQVFCEEVDV